MEISDYVINCMSMERTRDFLEMHGEQLTDFKPVLLKTTQYDEKGRQLDQAFEDLATQARDLGCKYVTNVRELGYSPSHTKSSSGGFLFFSPAGEYNAEMLLAGTGLIPKGK